MGSLGLVLCILVGCFWEVDSLTQPLEKELIELLEIAESHYHQSLSSSSPEEELEISESGFPYISGPKRFDDKIAIVGAGPAGVHMALKLKRAGFTNVIVFEKEDEVGGKSQTLLFRDTVQEMGTCYSQPDYTELYKLLEEFDAGELLPLPSPTVWTGEDIISTFEYGLRPFMDGKTGASSIGAFARFIRAVIEYVLVHKHLFGSYEGELMPRPSEEILQNELNMTFLQFLEKHDVEGLANIFLEAQTAQGYGHMDEVPALYGLTWMTPNYLVKALLHKPKEVSNEKLLSRGYQTVWKEIVKQEHINVRLSSPVTNIIREENSKFIVQYNDGSEKIEEFDFLILTPEMKLLSNLGIIDFNEEESQMFEKMQHQYYTSSLVTTTYGENRGLTPQSYFADNIESKVDMKIWVKRDSYNCLEYNVGEKYTNGLVPGGPDGLYKQTSVYYQFSKERPNKADLERELRAHIEDREKAIVLEISEVYMWPYFPQFSVADTASGITWDIFDMQGKYNIWYAGSSVYFESAKSVLEYNNLIFRQYRLPEEKCTKGKNGYQLRSRTEQECISRAEV